MILCTLTLKSILKRCSSSSFIIFKQSMKIKSGRPKIYWNCHQWCPLNSCPFFVFQNFYIRKKNLLLWRWPSNITFTCRYIEDFLSNINNTEFHSYFDLIYPSEHHEVFHMIHILTFSEPNNNSTL